MQASVVVSNVNISPCWSKKKLTFEKLIHGATVHGSGFEFLEVHGGSKKAGI